MTALEEKRVCWMAVGLWWFNLSHPHPVGWGRELGEEECSDKALQWRKEKLHTPAKQNSELNWFPISQGQAGAGPGQMSSPQALPALCPQGLGYPWGWLCPPAPEICSAVTETSLCYQQLPAQIQSVALPAAAKKINSVPAKARNEESFVRGWGSGCLFSCLLLRSVQTFRIPENLVSFPPLYHTFFLITQYQTSGSGKIKRSKCLPQLLLSDLIWYELPWALLSFCQEIFAQW